MKKTIALAGIAAISASTLHAQYAPDLTPTEKAKIWSVSATLRGFYDDNVTTLPAHAAPGQPSTISGFGLEASPSFGLNHTGDATTITGRYTYDFRKFFTAPNFTDQSHQLDAKIDHSFSERYNLKVSDSFVSAQEPSVIDTGVTTTPLRSNGNNVRNTGKVDFTAELTKLLSLQVGYQNSIYAYEQNSNDLGHNNNTLVSRSAELDRMEHLATINLLWRPVENTTYRLGYQYGQTEFSSPEVIIYDPVGLNNVHARVRNQRSHFVYVGVDHSFTPELTVQARVGGQYVDYFAAPNSRSQISPYADASVRYAYSEGSYAQLGIRHQHNTTDLVGSNLNDPVLDEESTAIYLRGNQKIASRVNLNWLGQYQNSSLNGGGPQTIGGLPAGGLDGRTEDLYIGQLNLSYQINSFVAAETGYEFDYLGSQISRSYKRQQVYVGIRASY